MILQNFLAPSQTSVACWVSHCARRTSTAFCARSASTGDQQASLALRRDRISPDQEAVVSAVMGEQIAALLPKRQRRGVGFPRLAVSCLTPTPRLTLLL